MKPRVSDEIKAALLARVYTDLMPKPPPKPKPKLKDTFRSHRNSVSKNSVEGKSYSTNSGQQTLLRNGS